MTGRLQEIKGIQKAKWHPQVPMGVTSHYGSLKMRSPNCLSKYSLGVYDKLDNAISSTPHKATNKIYIIC